MASCLDSSELQELVIYLKNHGQLPNTVANTLSKLEADLFQGGKQAQVRY